MTDLGAVAAVITFLVAAATPGPATLAVASIAMQSERQHGIAMGLGLAMGLAIWGEAAALGFGALVLGSPTLLTVMKIIGAGYLFYLAWQAGRAACSATMPEAKDLPHQRGPTAMFARGLMLNLSNPKAALAWIAALALDSGQTDLGVSAGLVIICALLGVGIYLCYAMVFSLPPVQAGYRRARRWIDGFAAVLFAAAGLRLLTWRGAA